MLFLLLFAVVSPAPLVIVLVVVVVAVVAFMLTLHVLLSASYTVGEIPGRGMFCNTEILLFAPVSAILLFLPVSAILSILLSILAFAFPANTCDDFIDVDFCADFCAAGWVANALVVENKDAALAFESLRLGELLVLLFRFEVTPWPGWGIGSTATLGLPEEKSSFLSTSGLFLGVCLGVVETPRGGVISLLLALALAWLDCENEEPTGRGPRFAIEKRIVGEAEAVVVGIGT